MKKKLCLFLAGGAALILLTCTVIAVTQYYNGEDYEFRRWIENYEQSDSFEDDHAILNDCTLDSNKDLKNIIYYDSELKKACSLAVDYCCHNNYWSCDRPYDLLNHLPTEDVRYMEYNGYSYYYVVYQNEFGGRYFVFYDASLALRYGFPVYMTQKLSMSDFDQVKEGTDISEVAKIDSAESAYLSRFELLTEGKAESAAESGYYPYTSTHILTDGVLQIEYEPGDDGYTVRNVYRNSEFAARNMPEEMLNSLGYYKNTDELASDIFDLEYIFKINERDYVTGDEPSFYSKETNKQYILSKDIDWSIRINVHSSDGVSHLILGKAEAEKLGISQIFASRYEEDNPKYPVSTLIMQGISMPELLALASAEDAVKVTVTDYDNNIHELSGEMISSDKALLTWIQNKEYAVDGSRTGIAFAVETNDPADFISSVTTVDIYLQD